MFRMLFRRFHIVDAACDHRLRLHRLCRCNPRVIIRNRPFRMMDFLRRDRPWIDFLGSTGSSSMALLIAGISGIATVFGALRACAGRLLAGGFETCSSTKIGRQQRGRFKLFLHELRIDLALLFRAEFAPRHRFGPVRQLFGRRERDARSERLMHFGADDFHHFGIAVHRFLCHRFGKRVFAERLVEFDPQTVAAQ